MKPEIYCIGRYTTDLLQIKATRKDSELTPSSSTLKQELSSSSILKPANSNAVISMNCPYPPYPILQLTR